MTARVYRLAANLQLPLERLESFVAEPTLPDGLEGLELTRRDDTVIISPLAAQASGPVSRLTGTVAEAAVPDEAAGPVDERTAGRPRWGGKVEMEQPTKVVEVAAFEGGLGEVLQHAPLEVELFEVLCHLARQADTGVLTAIVGDGETLEATRIVDGEDRPATVQIVEERADTTSGPGVNWRDNEYIT